MNARQYWILVAMAMILALLVVSEIYCENQASYLSTDVSEKEMTLNQIQQQSGMLRQILQKIAIESQHDPDLARLLIKRNIHVSYSTSPNGDVTASKPAAIPATSPSSPPTLTPTLTPTSASTPTTVDGFAPMKPSP